MIRDHNGGSNWHSEIAVKNADDGERLRDFVFLRTLGAQGGGTTRLVSRRSGPGGRAVQGTGGSISGDGRLPSA